MKPPYENCKTAAESVQARFEHWRKTRSKRGWIPEDLWSALEYGTLLLMR